MLTCWEKECQQQSMLVKVKQYNIFKSMYTEISQD